MAGFLTEIKQQRLKAFAQVDLYPVTCEEWSNKRSDFDVLDAVVMGGAKIIQLRDKNSSKRNLYEKAVKFREVTRKAGVLLIINDHLDIAVTADADGVHLGQDDFPLHIAKKFYPNLIIGASTHSLDDALTSENDGADYINIGPIFPTETKRVVKKFLGPELIQTVSRYITIPFTVMGGINSDNLDRVLAVGAKKIAMVTAITMAHDMIKTIREFRKRIIDYSPDSAII